VRGRNASSLSAPRHDSAFFECYWQTLQSTGRWEGEMWNRRKHGDEYPEWLRVRAVTDAGGRPSHHVCLFTDISMHKARERDLRRIGFEDPLTGLPNRRRLHDLMGSRLRHLRAGESLDMALIDIDAFKAFNDSLRLGLTIGSCRAPEDGRETGILFQRLESALYTAKRHGRNHSQRFRPALDVQESPQLGMVNDLRHALATGFQLEITESVLLDERAGDIAPRLEALRALGHPVAIDDFGTGYSSLGYLKKLPLDKLKLDRTFVRALPGDRADAAIVTAVLAMARGLDLEVIAEGVETEAQRDFLLAAGCELVQGFLYARPEPAGAIETRWLPVRSGEGSAALAAAEANG